MANGMIISGICGSSAIDKSGEMLDVAGCDISSWKLGAVALNFEHQSQSSEEHHHNPNDIVGKIIYARKILKESDCEDDDQLKYWKQIGLPFIYVIGRLADQAGHEGAKALAALIRDSHANNEPLITKFSIEGVKLEVDKGHIKHSIMKQVAITVKECNATAQFGLVSDPGAPEGYDKGESVDNLTSLVREEQSALKKATHLGHYEYLGNPLLGDLKEAKVKKAIKALLKLKLYKALTAGGGDVAPSQLTDGSALQAEGIVSPKHKKKAQELADAYDGPFNKSQFAQILKHNLPEVSDEYIQEFVNQTEATHAKKKGKSFELIVKMESLTVDLNKAIQDSKALKRPSVFEYHREGMSKPHTLQCHGENKFSLDGNALTDDEIAKIHENIQNKLATLRYKKAPNLTKSEEYLSELHSLSEFVNKDKPGLYAFLEFHFLDKVVNEHGEDTARKYLKAIAANVAENADCRAFMLNNHLFLLYAKEEDQLYYTLRNLREKLGTIVPIGGQYPAQFSAGIGQTIGLAHKALQQTEHAPGMVYSMVFGSEGAVPIDCVVSAPTE